MELRAGRHPADGGRQADRLGVLCSVGCAVHCAAVPLLLTLSPSLGAAWLHDPLFHQLTAAVCILLVYRGIWPAWQHHRDRAVAAMAGGGVAMLCLSSFVLPSCCGSPPAAPRSAVRAVADAGTIVHVSYAGRLPRQAVDGRPALASAGPARLLSRPLLEPGDLHILLGDALSLRLMGLQPYLNPLGGCLLIAAHVLNARLRRRRIGRCC